MPLEKPLTKNRGVRILHDMETGNVEKAILARLDQPESTLMLRVTRNNQILLHNFQAEVAKKCRCALEGCERAFGITLIPNQLLYPKFCDEHRSEFRREFHLQRLGHPSTALRVQETLQQFSSLLPEF